MVRQIFEMKALPPPFEPDEQIFYLTDEEGNRIGDPYSYNEWFKMINDVCGQNDELMERYADKSKTE